MQDTIHSVMDVKSREPLQNQLARIIKNDLIKHMNENDKLPPLKKIAEEYNVGFGVAQEAVNLLRKQGVVYSRVGSGTFVSSTDKLEGDLIITYPVIEKFDYAQIFTKLLSVYGQKNPNVRIQVRPAESSNFSEYVQYITNNGEDVAIVTDSHLADSRDIFIPLDNAESKLIREKCSSNVAELFKSGRKICVWPMLYSPNIVFCNEEYFENSKITNPENDWTIEQFLDIIEKIKQGNPGTFPFWLTAHINRWYNILINSELKITGGKKNPLPDVNTPEFASSVKLVKELLRSVPALLQEGELVRSFMQGRVGMIYGSYLSTLDCIKRYSGNSMVSRVLIRKIPAIANQNPVLVGIGAGINSKAKNINQARDFCRFIISEEAQNIIMESYCGLPVLKSIKIPDTVNINNIVFDSYNVCEDYSNGIVAKVSRQDEMWTAFGHEMQMYWSGIKNFEELREDLNMIFDN